LEAIDVAAAHTVGDIADQGVNGRWVRQEIEDGCDLGGETEVKVRCLIKVLNGVKSKKSSCRASSRYCLQAVLQPKEEEQLDRRALAKVL
jgi:hypothetical protein